MPRVRKVFFYAIPIVSAFLILEFVIRLAGYGSRPTHTATLSVTGYFLLADEIFGFRNRANGYYLNTAIQGSPVDTTDQYGYRNSYSCALPIAGQTVVFVGDSTTFCAEVKDPETGPSEVAKLLCSRGNNVRVVNAGVRGFNTLQSKRMLIETLTRFPSTGVAVYVYCDNDFVENLNSIVYYPLRAPTAQQQQETGEVVEKEVQSEIVPWGHGFESAVPPAELSVNELIKYGIALSHSALLQFSTSAIVSVFAKARITKISFTRLEDGSLGPIDAVMPEWKQQEEWATQHGGEKILEQLLREMHAACTKRGAEFIVTRFTTGEYTGADKWLAEICRRAEVRFVAISDKFKGDPKHYMARRAGFRLYDGHYGRNGTRMFAEAISPAIESALSRSRLYREVYIHPATRLFDAHFEAARPIED